MAIKIKVISLKRSKQRRENFLLKNDGLIFDFFDAIDGSQLSDAKKNDPNFFVAPLSFPSAGAYGCALSHLSLWNFSIQKNEPLTIAEDDAIFTDDFQFKSEKIVKELPIDWDFILWGWNFDSILSISDFDKVSAVVMLFDQAKMRQNITDFKSKTFSTTVYKLDKCFGIPAYTISPRGAEKFKELCFPMSKFELFFPVLNRNIPNLGIDISMNRIYNTTNSYVCFPPLVLTENNKQESTIQLI